MKTFLFFNSSDLKFESQQIFVGRFGSVSETKDQFTKHWVLLFPIYRTNISIQGIMFSRVGWGRRKIFNIFQKLCKDPAGLQSVVKIYPSDRMQEEANISWMLDTQHVLKKINDILQRIWVIATNSYFLISISLQPIVEYQLCIKIFQL